MQWTNQNLNTCSWSEARENMWKSGSNFLASRAVMQTQLLFDAQRNTALKWISLNVHQCSLSLEEFVNRFTSYRRRKSTFKSSAWSCLSVSLFVCLFQVCFYLGWSVLLLLAQFYWFLHRGVLKCSASLDIASAYTGEDTFTRKPTFLDQKRRCCFIMVSNS